MPSEYLCHFVWKITSDVLVWKKSSLVMRLNQDGIVHCCSLCNSPGRIKCTSIFFCCISRADNVQNPPRLVAMGFTEASLRSTTEKAAHFCTFQYKTLLTVHSRSNILLFLYHQYYLSACTRATSLRIFTYYKRLRLKQ